MNRIHLGQRGEDLAAQFLHASGYELLDANYRTGFGEIDLIAEDCGELVFVEVRSRRNAEIPPEETVTFRKQQKLIKTAGHYLSRHRQYQDTDWRIDIIGITFDDSANLINLDHLKGALEE